MGRRKQMHKDKQRGRNELIADFIEELTGVSRTRKQVSSHIQVLKPFVDQDEVIMRWLSERDHGHDASRLAGGYHHSSYTSGRQRSTYPAAGPQMQLNHHGSSGGHSGAPPSGREVRQYRQHLDVFEPVEFQLFARESEEPSGNKSFEPEQLHVYSRSTGQPLQADLHIADWASFQQDMPALAKLHAAKPIECNVLAVEASLAMPTRPWRDNKGVELAVILNCSSRRLLGVPKVRCINRFYKSGQPLPHSENNGSGDVPLTLAESKVHVETQLRFGSVFWANTLSPKSNLAKGVMELARAQQAQPPADPAELAHLHQSVDAEMRSISATQEISVLTDNGVEPVLIMHWSFRLSNCEVGSTVWRRMHLPRTMSQVQTLQQQQQQQHAVKHEQPTGGAVDTQFDFNNAPIEMSAAGGAVVSTAAQHGSHAALQSPFEYDSGSASAPSPSTWPSTISHAGSAHVQAAGAPAMSECAAGPGAESGGNANGIDFAGGSINMVFDSGIALDGFDNTAFGFDMSGAGAAAAAAAAAAGHPVVMDMDVQYAPQQWPAAGVGHYADGFADEHWHAFAAQQAEFPGYAHPDGGQQQHQQPPQHHQQHHEEYRGGYEGQQKHYEEPQQQVGAYVPLEEPAYSSLARWRG